MAFEPKQEKISKVLQESQEAVSQAPGTEFASFERTKQYQFTLQPSVREKIDRLAKEKGYRSASSFINEHFKKL